MHATLAERLFMGVEKQPVTLRWDPETIEMANQLQEDFSPFVEDRSHLSRLVIRLMHKLVRTNGTLAVLTAHLQQTLRISLSSQLEFKFPPQMRRGEEGAGSASSQSREGRLRVIAFSRLGRVRRVAGMDMASHTSFHSNFRPIFNGGQRCA